MSISFTGIALKPRRVCDERNADGNTGRKQARGGHPQSNARGVATTTLLGENLVEQVATLNRESHLFLNKPSDSAV
ncbi:hypothetical protein [Mastigocoleus testarum]|uniref:Uncharacterized protein n=1 Tax=Mastigocoleus testarum BC008 TaxID=371196 RepID=A0A0V7ZXJ0_9CYAN|nr:hypothetical protein [Mastigocoleus testarum]KST69301.1 hypothetical protein BC008_03690 [Mastigocoleus testarum BC008]KST69351.1 hypothetical protein BC008_03950 [Mastigocoleus testarum BC008]